MGQWGSRERSAGDLTSGPPPPAHDGPFLGGPPKSPRASTSAEASKTPDASRTSKHSAKKGPSSSSSQKPTTKPSQSSKTATPGTKKQDTEGKKHSKKVEGKKKVTTKPASDTKGKQGRDVKSGKKRKPQKAQPPTKESPEAVPSPAVTESPSKTNGGGDLARKVKLQAGGGGKYEQQPIRKEEEVRGFHRVYTGNVVTLEKNSEEKPVTRATAAPTESRETNPTESAEVQPLPVSTSITPTKTAVDTEDDEPITELRKALNEAFGTSPSKENDYLSVVDNKDSSENKLKHPSGIGLVELDDIAKDKSGSTDEEKLQKPRDTPGKSSIPLREEVFRNVEPAQTGTDGHNVTGSSVPQMGTDRQHVTESPVPQMGTGRQSVTESSVPQMAAPEATVMDLPDSVDNVEMKSRIPLRGKVVSKSSYPTDSVNHRHSGTDTAVAQMAAPQVPVLLMTDSLDDSELQGGNTKMLAQVEAAPVRRYISDGKSATRPDSTDGKRTGESLVSTPLQADILPTLDLNPIGMHEIGAQIANIDTTPTRQDNAAEEMSYTPEDDNAKQVLGMPSMSLSAFLETIEESGPDQPASVDEDGSTSGNLQPSGSDTTPKPILPIPQIVLYPDSDDNGKSESGSGGSNREEIKGGSNERMECDGEGFTNESQQKAASSKRINTSDEGSIILHGTVTEARAFIHEKEMAEEKLAEPESATAAPSFHGIIPAEGNQARIESAKDASTLTDDDSPKDPAAMSSSRSSEIPVRSSKKMKRKSSKKLKGTPSNEVTSGTNRSNSPGKEQEADHEVSKGSKNTRLRFGRGLKLRSSKKKKDAITPGIEGKGTTGTDDITHITPLIPRQPTIASSGSESDGMTAMEMLMKDFSPENAAKNRSIPMSSPAKTTKVERPSSLIPHLQVTKSNTAEGKSLQADNSDIKPDGPTSSGATNESTAPSAATTESKIPSAATKEIPTPSAATKESTVPSSATKEIIVPSLATKKNAAPPSSTKQIPVPPAATKENTVPSAATKQIPVPPAATKENTVPSAATKENAVQSAATTESTVPSSATKDIPVPSSATKEIPVPSAATKENPVPSSATTEGTVPSSATKDIPVPSSATKEIPVPSAATTEGIVPSSATPENTVPSAATKEITVPSVATNDTSAIPVKASKKTKSKSGKGKKSKSPKTSKDKEKLYREPTQAEKESRPTQFLIPREPTITSSSSESEGMTVMEMLMKDYAAERDNTTKVDSAAMSGTPSTMGSRPNGGQTTSDDSTFQLQPEQSPGASKFPLWSGKKDTKPKPGKNSLLDRAEEQLKGRKSPGVSDESSKQTHPGGKNVKPESTKIANVESAETNITGTLSALQGEDEDSKPVRALIPRQPTITKSGSESEGLTAMQMFLKGVELTGSGDSSEELLSEFTEPKKKQRKQQVKKERMMEGQARRPIEVSDGDEPLLIAKEVHGTSIAPARQQTPTKSLQAQTKQVNEPTPPTNLTQEKDTQEKGSSAKQDATDKTSSKKTKKAKKAKRSEDGSETREKQQKIEDKSRKIDGKPAKTDDKPAKTDDKPEKTDDKTSKKDDKPGKTEDPTTVTTSKDTDAIPTIGDSVQTNTAAPVNPDDKSLTTAPTKSKTPKKQDSTSPSYADKVRNSLDWKLPCLSTDTHSPTKDTGELPSTAETGALSKGAEADDAKPSKKKRKSKKRKSSDSDEAKEMADTEGETVPVLHISEDSDDETPKKGAPKSIQNKTKRSHKAQSDQEAGPVMVKPETVTAQMAKTTLTKPEQPAVKPSVKSVKEQTPKPAEKAVVKPAAKAVEKPAEKAVVKPAAKEVEKPAEKAVVKPAAKAVEKPAEKAVEKPVEKIAQKPVKEQEKKPAEKLVENPAEKAVEKPAEMLAQKPVEKAVKPVEKLAEKLEERPAVKTAEKPAKETVASTNQTGNVSNRDSKEPKDSGPSEDKNKAAEVKGGQGDKEGTRTAKNPLSTEPSVIDRKGRVGSLRRKSAGANVAKDGASKQGAEKDDDDEEMSWETEEAYETESEQTVKMVITGVVTNPNVSDPDRQDIISMQEAVERGVLNLENGVYRNTATGQTMPLFQAMNEGLVKMGPKQVETTKERVVSSTGVITVRSSSKVVHTYSVTAALNRKTGAEVGFHDALLQGLIDEKKGEYVDQVTGQRIALAEAVECGFVKAEVTK